jgi:hypothetical protein|tara:strand:+ start:1831 stop:2166 length:336 start_codon:yes stop_codon:yes gene_type:complete
MENRNSMNHSMIIARAKPTVICPSNIVGLMQIVGTDLTSMRKGLNMIIMQKRLEVGKRGNTIKEDENPLFLEWPFVLPMKLMFLSLLTLFPSRSISSPISFWLSISSLFSS